MAMIGQDAPIPVGTGVYLIRIRSVKLPNLCSILVENGWEGNIGNTLIAERLNSKKIN